MTAETHYTVTLSQMFLRRDDIKSKLIKTKNAMNMNKVINQEVRTIINLYAPSVDIPNLINTIIQDTKALKAMTEATTAIKELYEVHML